MGGLQSVLLLAGQSHICECSDEDGPDQTEIISVL